MTGGKTTHNQDERGARRSRAHINLLVSFF